MNVRRLAFLLSLVALPATAGELTCPDLSTARQVGNCPTEEELKMGYTGYCSDNQRMYDKDDQTCQSLDSYRRLKDVSLWEAGEFSGYVHCAKPADAVKTAPFVQVGALRVGKITRVVCSYQGEIDLTYRTKAACRVENGKAVCEE